MTIEPAETSFGARHCSRVAVLLRGPAKLACAGPQGWVECDRPQPTRMWVQRHHAVLDASQEWRARARVLEASRSETVKAGLCQFANAPPAPDQIFIGHVLFLALSSFLPRSAW